MCEREKEREREREIYLENKAVCRNTYICNGLILDEKEEIIFLV
jgi:hypothetical protein